MTGGPILFAVAFYLTAAVAIAAALLVVSHKNPVISAVNLVLCFFAVAVLYVLLHAHFLAVVQVLLYVGAVLVLFLMIVMLLNLDDRGLGKSKATAGKALGGFMVLGIVVLLALIFKDVKDPRPDLTQETIVQQAFLIHLENLTGQSSEIDYSPEARIIRLNNSNLLKMSMASLEAIGDSEVEALFEMPEVFLIMDEKRRKDFREEMLERMDLWANDTARRDLRELGAPLEFSQIGNSDILSLIQAAAEARYAYMTEFGSTRAVGMALFTEYLLPFEAASLLLLAAIIGVLLLARREKSAGES